MLTLPPNDKPLHFKPNSSWLVSADNWAELVVNSETDNWNSMKLIYPANTDGTRTRVAWKYWFNADSNKWFRRDTLVRFTERTIQSGVVRTPYHFYDLTEDDTDVLMLAKKFKKETTPYSCYFRDVEAQVAANQMALQFNKYLTKYVSDHEIRHLQVAVLQIKEDDTSYSFWGIERNSKEHFIRFNNNAGHIKLDHALPQAFVHYSYIASNKQFLFCDLQGWRNGDSFLLTDTMQLHRSKDAVNINLVMEKHQTNHLTNLCSLPLCQKLGLGGVSTTNMFDEESSSSSSIGTASALTTTSEATQTWTETYNQIQTQGRTQTQTCTYVETQPISLGGDTAFLEQDTESVDFTKLSI
eukprot:TRINITY_DN5215_c0_g1_i1.p1 TRINITY_DN5215_c0_g1~~TRINITY_DN5215_c0_g1_i1.p1  ORF type:complete len:355 (-),score=67.59 TRINITY_DN5215_c0_g1_i1:65-1129(-)